MINMKKILTLPLYAILLASLIINPVFAAGRGFSILRDAESEKIIRQLLDPLLIAADLDPASVDSYLLNSKDINAFVAGGQNIFIHSALILKAENASQLMGVLAHETGHISGGHLSGLGDAMGDATAVSLIGLLLGAAAIAAGSGDAGMAIMMGGQQVAHRTFLKHTRTQESSADQAAMTFLEKAGITGTGMIEFLGILGDQELVPERFQDPYARSHPFSSWRIAKIRHRNETSPFKDAIMDPVITDQFKRLQAKLFGYLKPTYATLGKYPVSNQSLYARYARTFAYHKSHNLKAALKEIDSLIKEYPDDPYFHEAKAQVLFENGKIQESLVSYRESIKKLDNPLLLISYAHALIEMEDNKYLKEATQKIELALTKEPDNSFGWLQASIAYHRLGDEANTRLATAEGFLLRGDIQGAMVNAKYAADLLPKNTPKWYRANDILVTSAANLPSAAEMRKKKRKAERKKSKQRRKLY